MGVSSDTPRGVGDISLNVGEAMDDRRELYSWSGVGRTVSATEDEGEGKFGESDIGPSREHRRKRANSSIKILEHVPLTWRAEQTFQSF